jgi:hypothetical protein
MKVVAAESEGVALDSDGVALIMRVLPPAATVLR